MTSMFKVLLFNFQKIHQKHMLWMGFLGMPKNILYKKKVVKNKNVSMFLKYCISFSCSYVSSLLLMVL